VNFNSDGSLNVNVNRFENANVWNAEHRHRVVVPKLADSLICYRVRVFFWRSPFLQPPSIRPISSSFFESSRYFSVGISLLSQAS